MVAKTLDISQPVMNTDRSEPRSDMFAQSNALYSRINKKSKASPWMIIAPVAVVVLVGGALVATSSMHSTAKAPVTPAPAASIPAPAASTPAPVAKPVATKSVKSTTVSTTRPALKVEAAPTPVRHAAARIPTTARRPADTGPAPSAYDHQPAVAAAPAPTVSTQPAAVTPAPAQSVPAQSVPAQSVPAPTTAAPTTAAPTPSTPAPAAAPAPDTTPAPTTPPSQ